MPTEEAKPLVFVPFPGAPPPLYESVTRAIEIANAASGHLTFRGWPESDIAGRPLTGPILSGIEEASLVVADVTFLNFNVTYEIGFAIGLRKRAYLVRNETFKDDGESVSKVGIFDTLGYVNYADAGSLATLLNGGARF